jgi:zinc transporter, ZIP family
LIDYWQLLLLGSIAGFTIFLGLPLAVLQNVSSKKKGFLNAIAIGILVFLIIDVFGHAWDSVGNAAQDTFSGKVAVSTGVSTILALFGGLVFYEERYMKKNLKQKWREAGLDSSVASSGGEYQHQLQLLQEGNAYRLSMMIAMGIGFHNFSEGLGVVVCTAFIIVVLILPGIRSFFY